MSFGIEVFSGQGQARLTSSKKTVRLIKTYQTPTGSSGSISVPDFSESKGFIAVSQSNSVGVYVSTSWDESTKTFSWNSTSGAWALVNFIHTE